MIVYNHKKTFVKRFVCGLLCLMTMLAVFIIFPTVQAQAAKIIDSGDFVFTLLEDGKSVEITQYNGKSLYVSLPTMVDKYKVTQVGTAAFMMNKTVKELEIPSSIEHIECNAFANCQSLKKVEINGSVETIGNCAFMNCTSLETLVIYEGVMEIGESAFSGCTLLRSVELPNSVITFP